MTIRVGAVQIALGKGSYSKALADAISLIQRASKAGAQVVCFPEHWLLEYGEKGYDAAQELLKVARSEKLFVITGANYTPAGDSGEPKIRVRSFLLGPDGEIIGYQDKVHLFRGEKKSASAGESYEVFDTDLGKIGIIVCYDNVFPEAFRTMVLKGADLLFVPSRIVSQGLEPWILYLRTRALENRVPVVAPNVFHPPQYLGGSLIIDLESEKATQVVVPKIVASAKTGESVIVADVNLDRARELRKERLSERRPQAYVGLES